VGRASLLIGKRRQRERLQKGCG